ncbi:MAG: TonB family protein [Candidatus Sulfotelmatobacter sp.]
MFDRSRLDGSLLDRTMFAEAVDSSWAERTRRGWTTLASFGLQAAATGVLLIVPLLRTTGLPSFHQLSTPISLGQPLREPESTPAHGGSNMAPSNPAQIIFRRPSSMPITGGIPIKDGPPQVTGFGPYVAGPTGGNGQGIIGLFDSGTRAVLPAPPVTIPHSIRLSHMSEGDLTHKVQPTYLALARSARIQGVVVLQAMISKLGTIENLKVLSGHPMLAPAAIDAVRQWRYRPYILNNEPVEVETQITVKFSLEGS